jgi:flagellar biosynthesis protein FlhB
MHNASGINTLIAISLFTILLYIVPLAIGLIVTFVVMIKSFFRNTDTDKYSDKYIYPMSIGEFIKRLLWSFVPLLNIILVMDFISKYSFYRKFGSSIKTILETEPHISHFKKK